MWVSLHGAPSPRPHGGGEDPGELHVVNYDEALTTGTGSAGPTRPRPPR